MSASPSRPTRTLLKLPVFYGFLIERVKTINIERVKTYKLEMTEYYIYQFISHISSHNYDNFTRTVRKQNRKMRYKKKIEKVRKSQDNIRVR